MLLSLKEADMYSKIIIRQVEENPETQDTTTRLRACSWERKILQMQLHISKTVEIDAAYKLPYSEIAKIYLRMNDKDRAIEYFKKSMKSNPDKPSPAKQPCRYVYVNGQVQTGQRNS